MKMWIPCWLRRIPLLVLVSVQLSSGALLLGQGPTAAPIRSDAAKIQADDGFERDPEWTVDLAPGHLQNESHKRWELPELGTPSWHPDTTRDGIRTDGSSLAERAIVVNSLPSSSGEVANTSMHTFYAIMAVLGLLAGGICCLQLSR